jgi:hypothetical protein
MRSMDIPQSIMSRSRIDSYLGMAADKLFVGHYLLGRERNAQIIGMPALGIPIMREGFVTETDIIFITSDRPSA